MLVVLWYCIVANWKVRCLPVMQVLLKETNGVVN